MILQHDIVYQHTHARRMTETLPLAEPRTSPILEINSLGRQLRRLEPEKIVYYYPRCRGNVSTLRDLPRSGRGEIGYDF